MKPKTSKLGNPLAAVAGVKVVEQASTALPFLIKLGAVTALVVVGYKIWSNRFVKKSENSNEPPANISLAQAKSRADAIYGSIGLVSNDFDNVSRQLSGLNYNGFIRVYNAFGHKTGTFLSGDLNLEEWCYNQFSDYQIKQLSFLLNGRFFQ